MQKAFVLARFIASHLAAIAVSVAVPVLLTLVSFIALFLAAIVFNLKGSGSPVALPAWLVIIAVASAAYATLLLFPSVAFAEVVSSIFGKWRYVAQIPLSLLALALMLLASLGVVNQVTGVTFELPTTFLGLALPRGLYWWTVRFVQAAFAGISTVARHMMSRFRSSS